MSSARRNALAGMFVACVLCVVGWAPSASAQTVYTYTGQPYTSCSGVYSAPCPQYELTGSFTLAVALADGLNDQSVDPTSFSFTDGSLTLTQSNTTSDYFEVTTSATGAITAWSIELVDNQESYSGCNGCTGYFYESGYGPYDELYSYSNSGAGGDNSYNYFYDYDEQWYGYDEEYTDCYPFEGCYTYYDYYDYETYSYYDSNSFSNASNDSAGTWDPTPEPPSYLLFGSGLLVLGVIFRKKRDLRSPAV